MVETALDLEYFRQKKRKRRNAKLFLYLTVVLVTVSVILLVFLPRKREVKSLHYKEQHRPQVHYSLPSQWMNDPNGLVFHNGQYHLFYQYHPHSKDWGPMHWGHAVSKDLLHWENLPTALFPDELGTIFSGCALVDERNVTGFQVVKSNPPMVAIFTQHLGNEGKYSLERQSLAYSNDNGLSWKMYRYNPILTSPGSRDFRDPKVIVYDDHYIMLIVAGEKVVFYKSHNLLQWEKLSEFGEGYGVHGGVWECPDMFSLKSHGKNVWILLVSINPKGPNGGSGTQYFVGFFDGTKFTSYNPPEKILWVDYGPDSYAGVTWYGTSHNTRLFISWMCNWDYCKDLPTDPWRGQMTFPRELSLKTVDKHIYLTSSPVPVLAKLRLYEPIKPLMSLDDFNIKANGYLNLISFHTPVRNNLFDIKLVFDIEYLDNTSTVELCLKNQLLESVCVGYSKESNQYFIDRVNSGKVLFHKSFGNVSKAPRLTNDSLMSWSFIVDVSSIEFFADEGLTVMTSLFYPKQDFNRMELKLVSDTIYSDALLKLRSANLYTLNPIWK